jgi:hypothetical protein
MGYDLHITRADTWVDSKAVPISSEEWAAYVAADPEMRMEGFAETEVDGRTLRVESPGLAVWVAYSGHGRDGNMAWFDHVSGEIVVKNPDREIIGKMKRIAAHFRAKVLGDDGESY